MSYPSARSNQRSGGAAGQRSISSGARAAPYNRPTRGDSRMVSASAWEHDNHTDTTSSTVAREQAAWPPSKISIRGTSGPTWVVVGNCLLGTSTEDIQETFQQFGKVVSVQKREPPGPNYPSCSFDVGFATRPNADAAIKALDKALADGRLLSVGLKHTPPAPPQTRMLRAAGVDHVPTGGANAHISPPLPHHQQQAVPVAPFPHGAAHITPSSMVPALAARAAVQARPRGKAPGKGVPVATPSLQHRLLSAPELRALQKKQAREKAAVARANVGPRGVGTGAAPFKAGAKPPVGTKAGTTLLQRIAPLPLAQRLAANDTSKAAKGKTGAAAPNGHAAAGAGKKRKGKAAGGDAPMSDLASLEAAKQKKKAKAAASKKRKQNAKADKAGGMDVD